MEDSEYDPHTYTMHLASPYSDRPFGDVIIHEVMHWIQYICYTFGGFVNASIHIRDECAKHILSEYARLKDECQRHHVQFSLPENVEAFFNSTFDHEGTEQNIWLYQIAWRDELLCERLFLRMSSFYEGELASAMSSAHEILQPELLIPRTLLRMNNWAMGTLCYRSIEPRGPLEITDFAKHPKLSNFGQAIHTGIELDTIDIIEGMSTAFEMYTLHSNRMELYAKQRLEEIDSTPASAYYVRAISLFLEIMGFSVRHDNIARMALMFLAIAEMSLNPPLPPFGIISKLELDWNKIYPPLRFIELCHIAKRVVGVSGYILDPNPYTWISDWIADVEALYLSQGGVFSYLSKNKDGYLPLEKAVPFLALIAEKNPNMREILRLKGVNIIGMAEKLPEVLEQCTGLELYAMLRHGHILFMNWFGTPRPFLIPLELEKGRELYVPPLVVFEDGHASCGWSEDFLPYLIDFNLFHYPLHDIMLRKEPRLYLPDSPLIGEERRKEQWRHLQKTFSHIF